MKTSQPNQLILGGLSLLLLLSGCGSGNAATGSVPALTLTGNDVFATVQEAVNKLIASPDTKWDRVDTEALRQHLIDMKHFSEDVSVISKTNIEKGVVIVIKATPEALPSIERTLAAHPAQLFNESGWTMEVKQQSDEFTLTVTTEKSDEIAKIRGLGYIGLMTIGGHHTLHHWAMISGDSPHAH